MSSFEKLGAERVPGVLDVEMIARIQEVFGDASRPGHRLTARQLAPVSDLLAEGGHIGDIATVFAKKRAWPVRALLLEKSPKVNWRLGWHQDRTIAVRRRIQVPGFSSWTTKAGQLHVQPPPEITASMLTLRVHLDHVGSDNAPLLALAGSHLLGRLLEEEIEHLVGKAPVLTCLASAGDVWVYRTAIVHASAEQQKLARRRVLQIDYATVGLPGGLQWMDLTGG